MKGKKLFLAFILSLLFSVAMMPYAFAQDVVPEASAPATDTVVSVAEVPVSAVVTETLAEAPASAEVTETVPEAFCSELEPVTNTEVDVPPAVPSAEEAENPEQKDQQENNKETNETVTETEEEELPEGEQAVLESEVEIAAENELSSSEPKTEQNPGSNVSCPEENVSEEPAEEINIPAPAAPIYEADDQANVELKGNSINPVQVAEFKAADGHLELIKVGSSAEINEFAVRLGIEGNVEAVVSSNPDAISVVDGCIVINSSFEDEILTFTVDGQEITICAHDPNRIELNQNVIDALDPEDFTISEDSDFIMTSNIVLPYDITINSGVVVLDLNGYSLKGTGTGSVVTVNSGVKFTLTDSSGSGTIDGNGGNGITVNDGADVFLKGGNVVNCADGSKVTLGNNGYVYSDGMTTSAVNLSVKVESGTINSIEWLEGTATGDGSKPSSFKTSTVIKGLSPTFTPTSGNWYKCKINGTTESEPLQAIKVYGYGESEDARQIRTFSYGQWYLGNGTMLYTYSNNGSDKKFDVLGRFTKTYTPEEYYYSFDEEVTENQTITFWANTSYSDGWQMYTSTSADPTPENKSWVPGNAYLDAFYVYFEKDNEHALHLLADLADDQASFSFGSDTMLADYTVTQYCDSASLKAIINGGKLKQVQMVGAYSVDDALGTDPAIVIVPNTPASKFWIGPYDDRVIFDYNNFDLEGYLSELNYYIQELDSYLNMTEEEFLESGYGRYYSYDEFRAEVQSELDSYQKAISDAGNICATVDGDRTVQAEINGTDSGMTMSWINQTPGSVIDFQFNVGSVAETGAVTGASANATDHDITIIPAEPEEGEKPQENCYALSEKKTVKDPETGKETIEEVPVVPYFKISEDGKKLVQLFEIVNNEEGNKLVPVENPQPKDKIVIKSSIPGEEDIVVSLGKDKDGKTVVNVSGLKSETEYKVTTTTPDNLDNNGEMKNTDSEHVVDTPVNTQADPFEPKKDEEESPDEKENKNKPSVSAEPGELNFDNMDPTYEFEVVDENGDPILAEDENGNPIPVLDEEGKPKLDDKGQPIYETVKPKYEEVPLTDEKGEPVIDKKTGEQKKVNKVTFENLPSGKTVFVNTTDKNNPSRKFAVKSFNIPARANAGGTFTPAKRSVRYKIEDSFEISRNGDRLEVYLSYVDMGIATEEELENNKLTVIVDGIEVDPACYSVRVGDNGDIIIEFTEEFIAGLEDGNHSLAVEWENRTYNSVLTIA